MKPGEVDPGRVILTLLEDVNSWKGEDILPEEHISMLNEAEGLLLEAQKFHKRYQTSKATLEAKQRNRSPQTMVVRYQREAQDNAYRRDNFLSQAEGIIGEIIAQIEKMADES